MADSTPKPCDANEQAIAELGLLRRIMKQVAELSDSGLEYLRNRVVDEQKARGGPGPTA